MPKVTITLEYDDGTIKSHSATLPVMPAAALDQMVDDAATQAGYQAIVPIETIVDGETITEDGPNPKTTLRHLCGWTFKVWAKLVKSHRASQAADSARLKAVGEVDTIQSAVKVE